jgi:hypothetical protein
VSDINKRHRSAQLGAAAAEQILPRAAVYSFADIATDQKRLRMLTTAAPAGRDVQRDEGAERRSDDGTRWCYWQ